MRTSRLRVALLVTVCLVSAASAAKKGPAKSWTDPKKAAAENKDFAIQGEYVGEVAKKKSGIQVVAIGSGKFIFACLDGGLPGKGWDAKSRTVSLGETSDAKTITLKGERFAKAVFGGTSCLQEDGWCSVFAVWAFVS